MGKNKKTVKQTVMEIAAHAARSMANETNALGWPPVCMGLFYQPKRPTNIPSETAFTSNYKGNTK